MTSNTTPSGQVICAGQNSAYIGREYFAFDDNYDTIFPGENLGITYIGYKFEAPVCAKSFSLYFERIPQEFSIEASNDGNSWVTLKTVLNNSKIEFIKEALNNSDNEYLYYRCVKIKGDASYNSLYVSTFQLYGKKTSNN